MKNIQDALKNFLIYWFVLTIIPGMINTTNQLLDFVIACVGFIIIIQIVPIILTFFKFDPKNTSTYLLVGSILSVAYAFILKPGVLGILYYPQNTILGNVADRTSLFRLELNEFGIIILIGVVSLLLSLFFQKKFK